MIGSRRKFLLAGVATGVSCSLPLDWQAFAGSAPATVSVDGDREARVAAAASRARGSSITSTDARGPGSVPDPGRSLGP